MRPRQPAGLPTRLEARRGAAVEARLDRQRFRYALWRPSPLTGITLGEEEVSLELGRRFFRAAERALCDSPLRVFAGFYVAAIEKRG